MRCTVFFYVLDLIFVVVDVAVVFVVGDFVVCGDVCFFDCVIGGGCVCNDEG